MVDVEHFLAVFVDERVRHRPADAGHFLEVDRALVVGVVELHWSHERHVPRRIDVVGDLALRDADVVALDLVEERPVALHGAGLLEGPHHLVVARLVERLTRAARLQRAKHRRPLVSLVVPELVFLLLLDADRNRDRDRQRADVGALGGEPETAALRRTADGQNQGRHKEACARGHGRHSWRRVEGTTGPDGCIDSAGGELADFSGCAGFGGPGGGGGGAGKRHRSPGKPGGAMRCSLSFSPTD